LFRIDNVTAVPSLPVAGPAGSPGFFTDGNPAAALEATVVDGWWLNLLQEEVLTVVEEAGLAPDKSSHRQLFEALNRLYLGIDAAGRYLPLTGGTIYAPGVSDPLTIRADAGSHARIRYVIGVGGIGGREWSVGEGAYQGEFSITDETANAYRMTFRADGWVDTVDQHLSGRINVLGVASKTGGGVWADISDSRVKKDVADYAAGLAELRRLTPVSYLFNGLGGTPEDGRRYYGLIAQNVLPVMPEMVGTQPAKLDASDAEETEIYTMDYTALTFALVNAVKELADRLDTLMPAERRSR
jgi:hypothetical protein